ncbi:uncharacterized protein LOC115237128 [Formica exsecta]|uniref:uncharacterized protein LOC115237128 n=1 Tax=Formica exsecta TaxID=72781 RepID=UPI00114199FF|nr:uncharacterized protein LOC115237128 [Formica exsecta]
MAMEILGRGITKFDGSDFQTWKFKVKQLLMAHGLEDLVDGTRIRPAGGAADAAVKVWVKDNSKAMSLISTAIERKQLRGLITCSTARDMWMTLTGIYEQKSASNRLLLLQSMYQTILLQKQLLQNLASQLKDAGQDITEVDIMAKILGSLPAKYSTLATAWDSVPVEEQRRTFCPCYKKKRDKEKDTDNDRENNAFVATVPSMKNNKWEVPPSSEAIQELKSMNSEDTWITDSGASRHMTYRREWLTDLTPLAGELVSLGNSGQCKVTGSGTVIIDKLVNGKWQQARIEDVLLVPDIKKNLFSVGACARKGYNVIFDKQSVVLMKRGKIQAVGHKQSNDIYKLFFKVNAQNSGNEANMSATNLRQWHERLRHINIG